MSERPVCIGSVERLVANGVTGVADVTRLRLASSEYTETSPFVALKLTNGEVTYTDANFFYIKRPNMSSTGCKLNCSTN